MAENKTETRSDNQDLIHRLNRIQGQLEAIKTRLLEPEQMQCTDTLQQLKAASRALKKFGEAYVQRHLKTCLSHKDSGDVDKDIADAISAAFNF